MRRSVQKRMNHYEKLEMLKAQQSNILKGEGLFIYRNNTKGDLTLPKPAVDGRKTIAPGKEWQGDSYFKFMLKSNEATMVRCLVEPSEQRKLQMEQKLMEQKLLLDQPDQVTAVGKIEHVVAQPGKKPLNEVATTQQDILLTEDPMSGVEIIN